MKLIFTLTAAFLSTCALAQKFGELGRSSDVTYGYTPENPIKLKRGNPGKSTNFAISFLTNLEAENGQQLVLKRTSIIQDPKYAYPVRQIDFGRETASLGHRAPVAFGTPMGENIVDRGLLQEYMFLTTAGQDTVRLYVDIYHRDDFLIPSGLKIKEE